MITKIQDRYASEEGSIDQERERDRRILAIHTSDFNDTRATLMRDRRIPRIGDRWRLGRDARRVVVVNVKFRKVTDTFWLVEVDYETVTGTRELPSEPGSIITARIAYAASSVRREVVYHEDIEGKPIRNSIGQKFENPPPWYKYNRRYAITWKQWTYDDYQYLDVIGTCNKAPMQLRGINSQQFIRHDILCCDVQARTSEFDEQPCWEVTGIFEYNADGWRPTYLANEGTLHYKLDEYGIPVIENGSKVLIAAADEEGTKHGKPIFLTLDGRPLPKDWDIVKLPFNFVAEGDFARFRFL